LPLEAALAGAILRTIARGSLILPERHAQLSRPGNILAPIGARAFISPLCHG
jgi:hypothetical protein